MNAPRQRGRRWWRRGLIGLLVSLATVLVLVALAVVWLTQTAPGRALLQRQVLALLNNSVFTGELQVEAIEGPVLGHLIVRGATLTDDRGVLTARVERAEARFRVLPLIRQRLFMDSLYVTGVEIDARIRDDGSLNLASLIQPGDPDREPNPDRRGFALVFDDLRLNVDRFTMVDGRVDDSLVVELTKFYAAGDATLDGYGGVDAGLSRLGGIVEFGLALGRRFPGRLDDLRFIVDEELMTFTVDRLTIAGTGLFGFDGRIDRSDVVGEPFTWVAIEIPELVLEPDVVEAFVPGIGLLIPLTLDARVVGPPGDVQLQATIDGEDQQASLNLGFDLSVPADPIYRGRMQVARFRPERWIDLGELTGDVSASIKLRAGGLTAESFEGAFQIDMGPSRVLDWGLEGAFMAASYRGGVFRLDRIEAWALTTRLFGEASGQTSGDVRLELRLDAPDLAVLALQAGLAAADEPLVDEDGAAYRHAAPTSSPFRGAVRMELVVDGNVPPQHRKPQVLQSPLRILRQVVPNLRIRGTLQAEQLAAPDGVRLDRLDLRLNGEPGPRTDLDLTASLRGGQLAGQRVAAADLSLRLLGERLAARLSVNDALGATGNLALDGTWTETAIDLRVSTLAATWSGIEVATTSAPAIDLRFEPDFSLTSVRVRDLDLRVDRAIDVALDASWRAPGAITARVRMPDTAIADLTRVADLATDGTLSDLPVRGLVRFEADVDGRLDAPTGRAALTLTDVAYESLDRLTGAVVVEQRRQDLALTAAINRSDATVLDADLTLPLRAGLPPQLVPRGPVEGYVRVPRIRLGALHGVVPPLADWSVQGDLGARVELSGTGRAGRAVGRVTLADLAFVAPDGVTQPPLAMDGLDLQVDANLDELMPGGPGATVAAQLTWHGEVLASVYGDADAPLRPLLADLPGAPERLRTVDGQLRVWIPRRHTDSLPAGLLPPSLPVSGDIGATANVARFAARSHAEVYVTSEELAWSGVPVGSVSLAARTGDDTVVRAYVLPAGAGEQITLQARSDQGFASLLGDGFVPATPIEARLAIPRTPWPWVDSLLSGELGAVSSSLEDATVSGFVDVTGTPLRPRVLARVALRDYRTNDGPLTMSGAQLRVDGPIVDAQVFVCGDGLCALNISLDAALPDSLYALVTGTSPRSVEDTVFDVGVLANDAPLGALLVAGLLDALVTDVRGQLDSDLHAHGTLASPRLAGRVRLRDGAMGIVPLGRTFSTVAFELHASGSSVVLRDLDLRDRNGRAQGEIAVELERGMPRTARADLRLRTFLLADTSGLGVTVSTHATAVAADEGARYQVDVQLRDTTIQVPDALGGGASGARELGPEFVFVPEGQPLDPRRRRDDADDDGGDDGDDVAIAPSKPIHVHVRSQGRMRVQHTYADLDLTTDLRLVLAEDGITTSGEVRVPTGRAQVLGRRFDISDGLVLFDGSGDGPFDPRLRVSAVHTLSPRLAAQLEPPSGPRSVVSVDIDSNVSNLELRLTSDPDMSQSDIFYLLITGSPPAAAALDTGGDLEQQPQALSAAGGVLLGLLSDRIGASNFTLSVEGGGTRSGIGRVEGGTYISERLYVAANYFPAARDDENNVEAALQLIIARLRTSSLRMELRWGDRNSGGAEFLYDLRIDDGLNWIR